MQATRKPTLEDVTKLLESIRRSFLMEVREIERMDLDALPQERRADYQNRRRARLHFVREAERVLGLPSDKRPVRKKRRS